MLRLLGRSLGPDVAARAVRGSSSPTTAPPTARQTIETPDGLDPRRAGTAARLLRRAQPGRRRVGRAGAGLCTPTTCRSRSGSSRVCSRWRIADVVAGRIRFILPSGGPYDAARHGRLEEDHEPRSTTARPKRHDLFLRRELFDRVGPFEEEVPEFGDSTSCSDASPPERRSSSRAARSSGIRPATGRSRSSARSGSTTAATRRARAGAGRVPGEIAPKALVPFVTPLRSRRWWGRSVGPDRRWLGENDVIPTRIETLKALPIMYLVVPYLRAAAQFRGWLDGRRLRSAAELRARRP